MYLHIFTEHALSRVANDFIFKSNGLSLSPHLNSMEHLAALESHIYIKKNMPLFYSFSVLSIPSYCPCNGPFPLLVP